MSKSVEELFKDAPNGATHYNSANHMFYRFCGGRGEVFHFSFMDWQDASALHEYGSLMIERPQTKPWSGPEDGLPPIGSIVLARRSDTNKWHESEVLRHSTEYQRSCVCAFMEVKSNMMFWSNEYKAIKTPDQISAEKRETAIRELMDVAQVDCRVTAARLVDAGFSRSAKKAEGRDAAIDAMKSTFDSVSDQLVPTSNKYLETLFGALYDAGFKREVV